jgi:hypothetical protein
MVLHLDSLELTRFASIFGSVFVVPHMRSIKVWVHIAACLRLNVQVLIILFDSFFGHDIIYRASFDRLRFFKLGLYLKSFFNLDIFCFSHLNYKLWDNLLRNFTCDSG